MYLRRKQLYRKGGEIVQNNKKSVKNNDVLW